MYVETLALRVYQVISQAVYSGTQGGKMAVKYDSTNTKQDLLLPKSKADIHSVNVIYVRLGSKMGQLHHCTVLVNQVLEYLRLTHTLQVSFARYSNVNLGLEKNWLDTVYDSADVPDLVDNSDSESETTEE